MNISYVSMYEQYFHFTVTYVIYVLYYTVADPPVTQTDDDMSYDSDHNVNFNINSSNTTTRHGKQRKPSVSSPAADVIVEVPVEIPSDITFIAKYVLTFITLFI